jgi:hypothetical protein
MMQTLTMTEGAAARQERVPAPVATAAGDATTAAGDAAMTMGDARVRYYERNEFGADGGDSLTWVPIKFLGLTFYIPNTDARRRAVRVHDLHHILTGYQTDMRGETEIAAWELASGCWRWPAALVLNLGALGLGAVIAPRRIARAWARGRQTRNLYSERGGIDHLLPRVVGEVRGERGLDAPPPPVRARDALAVGALATPMLAANLVLAAPMFAVALIAAALTRIGKPTR